MNAAAAARGYKMATAVEKIFSAKAGRPVKAGDIVVVEVDACMIHDVNGPTAVKNFAQIAKTVKSPAHHLIVLDHFAPCPNAAAGNNHLLLRRFAKEHGIRLVDVCKGVCHQKMLESGKVRPGGIAVGTDSHSCTYGALNAFSTGVGAAEAAVIFACDQCWFKVPPDHPGGVCGKAAAQNPGQGPWRWSCCAYWVRRARPTSAWSSAARRWRTSASTAAPRFAT